eukprot:5810414-Pleurochrysis_carterae.AAC.1
MTSFAISSWSTGERSLFRQNAIGTTQSDTRAMSNSMEGEPYGFEAPWADMSDDSERGAWEDYNQAKQRVFAMIKDVSYETVPDMGIPDPSLIL